MSYRSELIQVAAVALAALQVHDVGSTEIDSLIGRNKMTALLAEVSLERERQERKWGSQRHKPLMWLTILAEEFGESAEDVAKMFDANGVDPLLVDIIVLGREARDILERRPSKIRIGEQ